MTSTISAAVKPASLDRQQQQQPIDSCCPRGCLYAMDTCSKQRPVTTLHTYKTPDGMLYLECDLCDYTKYLGKAA